MRVAHVITRLIVGGAQENTVATVFGLHRKADVTVRLYSGPTTGPEGSLESGVRDIAGLFHLISSLIHRTVVTPPRPFLHLQYYLPHSRLTLSFPTIFHHRWSSFYANPRTG